MIVQPTQPPMRLSGLIHNRDGPSKGSAHLIPKRSLESHLQIELTNDNYQELAMAAYELAMLLIETN